MGTWGAGNFENDSALDFWGDLQGTDRVDALLSDALEAAAAGVLDEQDIACAALVAAEIVAAHRGRPTQAPPRGFREWVEIQGPTLRTLGVDVARRAVDQLMSGGELYDLWAQEDLEEWLEHVRDLRQRLDA